MTTSKETQEFAKAVEVCRDLYGKKLEDYGTSWRMMRPSSLTDQIYIKAKRIRNLEEGAVAQVPEGIFPEFIGIVNYGVIALIQLTTPGCDLLDLETARRLYDEQLERTLKLYRAKNHDYGAAWREMRVSSFTDIILQKLMRTKEIEDHQGVTKVSEGLEANYMDMIVYALFAIIKLSE